MSLESLIAFWYEFKEEPWGDEWFFDPNVYRPIPPDISIGLEELLEFREWISLEPGPYGGTNPIGIKALDGYLEFFLLPFMAKRQFEFVQLFHDAMKRDDLVSLSIGVLSTYFAGYGYPDNPRGNAPTIEEKILLKEALSGAFEREAIQSYVDLLNAMTLVNSGNLSEFVKPLYEKIKRLPAEQASNALLSLEGCGWLTASGELLDSRQPVTRERYIEISKQFT